MKKTFYSNGKLLITAEYLVLKGAVALALPTKFGQSLTVKPIDEPIIHWKSYDSDDTIWLETSITFQEIIELQKTEDAIKNQLILILHHANLASNFIQNIGFEISTQLTFPRNWGLGSSSTLINNLDQWLQIDGYDLLAKTFGGSGYDLACAAHDFPITFQLQNNEKQIKKVNFQPDFTNNLYFVYLNKKQNSRNAIASFYNKTQNLSQEIEDCNQITYQIINCNNWEVFTKLLQEHENLLKNILETPTVQELYFNDFKGVVKSLGAWGGDFCLVATQENPKEYFREKGYEVVISYDEMILTKSKNHLPKSSHY
jgi:mevalonate kinase